MSLVSSTHQRRPLREPAQAAHIVGAAPATITFTDHERAFVFGVAMRYMKDEEAAADVTQDALLLAFERRDSFRGDSRFSTWLYRIAVTTSLVHLRRARYRALEASALLPGGGEPNEPADSWPSAAPSPEEVHSMREQLDLAGERLTELGDKYRSIFELWFCDGYTAAEIGSRLGLKEATVKTRAHRARIQLRDLLRRQTPGQA